MDAAKGDFTAEPHRQAPLIGRNPNRRLVQALGITVLRQVLNPRHDSVRFDFPRSKLYGFFFLDQQLQQILITAAKDSEIKPIADFEVDASREIYSGNRVEGILGVEFVNVGSLSGLLPIYCPAFSRMIEPCFGIDDL